MSRDSNTAVASIDETHSVVAGVTPQGQLRTLHRTADAEEAATPPPTAERPAPTPGEFGRSTTRGEAEGTSPGSQGPEARKRHSTPPAADSPRRANRVFVYGSDGNPLMPCTMRRARMLIDAGRVSRREYRPFTIHLKDRAVGDGNTTVQPIEVRCTPGARHSGVAVVAILENEDRVLYQEEIEHRTNISGRLEERKAYRRSRRSKKWFRAPRFNNRRRGEKWLPPSIESIVSNQQHRMQRLTGRSGAGKMVVQTAKFDTHKILNPEVQGTGYQRGPLYRQHVRAYIAAQWNHRCAYCSKGDWEDATRFNLDHVVPRTAGGPDNVRNLVWSCRPCNQQKAEQPVDMFLRDNPERLTAVLRRRKAPLAAAGQHAVICAALIRRLQANGVKTAETTGADTAHTRKRNGMAKTHADDAACCNAEEQVTQLRKPVRLRSVGHGRRKQIKSLPVGPYLRWRHQKPAVRRSTPCPGHAHDPNHVHGISTGDLVRIATKTGWRNGTAAVEAGSGQIRVRTRQGNFSTSKAARVRKIATRNGYRDAAQT